MNELLVLQQEIREERELLPSLESVEEIILSHETIKGLQEQIDSILEEFYERDLGIL